MLNVEHLTVCRDARLVLDNVTFTLPPGQIAAVLGRNGAGKTTLVQALLGLIPQKSGAVTADGQPLCRLLPADRAKKLAYVPQRQDGGFRYCVEEFVSMGVTAYLGVFSRPGRDSLRRAREILVSLNCGCLVGRTMDKLSGGEFKMAYLARAMIQDADYLLLDEPVSSLDFSRQHDFLTNLRQYIGQRRSGCLLTIHAPELAYAYADRVMILHGGRLLTDTDRSDPEFREKLAQGLKTVYGPAVQIRFYGRDLALGWDPLKHRETYGTET